MSSFWLDIRYAIRVLAKQRGVSVIAIFTLALAIGATTAIFSVVYGVLLRPLPYPAAERLLAISEVNHRGTYSRLSDPNFDDFRDRNRTFSEMAKYSDWIRSVDGPTEPTRTDTATVSKDFFKVLAIQPFKGRSFTADDCRIGAIPAAIVSHRYWVQALGAAEPLSSIQLRLGDRGYAVVGVMPAGFAFPANVDLWVPLELDPEIDSRTAHNYSAIGRLRAGATVTQANSDLSAIAQDIVRHATDRNDYLLTDAVAVPLETALTGRVGSTLYVLLGAVFFLLLVACANVTNLLLAQATARQRQLAIRQALGAGRGRVVRQFVVESLVLLAASCAVGVAVASLGLRALLAIAPPDLPRIADVSMSGPVLAFAMGVSTLVALAVGLFTAVRATGRDPRDMLAEGSRGQAGASSQLLGGAIVAAQVAITVVLLVGAALLGRSLLRVLSVNPGFRTEQILTMDVSVPSSDDPGAKTKLSLFYASLFERLRAIPGVDEVAAANALPLDGGLADGLFLLISPKDVPAKMDDLVALFNHQERTGSADFCTASPAYFHALGIPLLRGRLFDERDRPNQPNVAVISASLAKSRWPNQNPIAQTIEFGNMDGNLRPLTIVGIVGDTHEEGLEQPPHPTVYVDLMQRPPFAATVIMRSGADPQVITGTARRILHDLAPEVPLRFRTFGQIYTASLGERHFNLTLVVVFAGTALVLAVAGIYGVMSYTVSRRRREIGVRIALGATPGRVTRGVLGQGVLTTAAGVAIGVLGAFTLTRALKALLFGVTATDPVSFGAVVLLLGCVAALASYVPARRATRVNPVEALRHE